MPALYLETLAINKGSETASSQRFSYFGPLAEGEGGDGACVGHMNNDDELPAPFDGGGRGLYETLPPFT